MALIEMHMIIINNSVNIQTKHFGLNKHQLIKAIFILNRNTDTN